MVGWFAGWAGGSQLPLAALWVCGCCAQDLFYVCENRFLVLRERVFLFEVPFSWGLCWCNFSLEPSHLEVLFKLSGFSQILLCKIVDLFRGM